MRMTLLRSHAVAIGRPLWRFKVGRVDSPQTAAHVNFVFGSVQAVAGDLELGAVGWR